MGKLLECSGMKGNNAVTYNGIVLANLSAYGKGGVVAGALVEACRLYRRESVSLAVPQNNIR